MPAALRAGGRWLPPWCGMPAPEILEVIGLTEVEVKADPSPAFDLVVIGGGPGGYAAALYAGNAGLSVAVVEKEKVGGTCLHRGCIPAKEFLETAAVFRTVSGAKEFGVQASQPTVEFSTSQDRKQKVVDQLHRGLAGLMKQRKNVIFEGTGRLLTDHVVEVTAPDGSAQTISGSNIVLASGSVPRTLPGFEVDGRYVLTSDEVLSLRELPRTAVVIGGGAIGCEFASMLSDLGVQVTILEALPKLLPGCDEDVANVVVRSFQKRGITVRAGVAVHGHQPGEAGTTVSFGEGESVLVDSVIVSVGRSRSRTACSPRGRASWSTSAALSRWTSGCGRRRPGSLPSVTSSTRPSSPTSVSPRPSSSSSRSSGSGRCR